MIKTFDKERPLIEYLNYILLDENNNQGYVTRDFTADLVCCGEKRGEKIYKYENIKWKEPFIKPLLNEFNEEGEILIIGKALESDMKR